MIAAAVILALGVAAQPPAAPRFERILYLHGGPPRDRQMLERMRRLGFTAVSHSRGEDAAAPGRAGLRFYADQIVGKGVLELRASAWRAVRRAYLRGRDVASLVRPACLAEPAVEKGLEEALRTGLEQIGGAAPLAISLGDEISVTRHANPLDLCWSVASLRSFRSYLRDRYPTVEALNRAWSTDFGAFATVVPWTADRIRARELQGYGLPRNLRPWAEHLEFMDRELARIVGRLARLARQRAPNVPCGLTGLQPPSAYGGHDYARLLPLLSFYEAYDIGGGRDLAQCLAPPDALQVATVFPPVAPEPVEMVRARCCDFLAHGMGGLIAWSSGDLLDDRSRPTAYARELASTFGRIERAREFASARLLRSPVWIVESQASVRAHWMLDSAGDGRTWINRLSSYEADHSTSLAARASWLRLLEDLGLQGRMVVADTLAASLARARPRLLVLPALLALSDEAVAAVASYVAAGGVAVADHGLAFYDEHLGLRRRPALDEVFGVERRRWSMRDLLVRQGRPRETARLPSGAAAAEAGIAGALGDPSGRFEVQLEHSYGKGQTIYLNLAVCEYGRVRLDAARVAAALDLRQRVGRVLAAAGVEPSVLVHADGLPTCIERLRLVGRGGRRLLAVRVNALESPALMAELGRRGPRPAVLVFRRKTAVHDLVTGVRAPAAYRHQLALDPWWGLFMEIEERP